MLPQNPQGPQYPGQNPQVPQYPQYPQQGPQYPAQPGYPPQPGSPPLYPQPQKSPNVLQRGWKWYRSQKGWLQASIAVAIVVVVIVAASSGNGQTTSTTSPTATLQASGPTATHKPAATAKPTTKPVPHFGDGTYQVGKDVQPGTYRTRSATDNCYYERLSGFGGTLDEIISNNNTSSPAIVTIAASDKGFTSEGCGTWTQDLSQITTSKTNFGDGMYFVGTDITPGTYKNSGVSDNCYYERLSGFGGTLDEIISNNNVSAPTIVTISASDKGFSAQGCGTWSKQ